MLKSTRTLPWCCVVNLLLAEDSVDFCLESPPAPCQDGLLVALCSFHDALYFCIPLIKVREETKAHIVRGTRGSGIAPIPACARREPMKDAMQGVRMGTALKCGSGAGCCCAGAQVWGRPFVSLCGCHAGLKHGLLGAAGTRGAQGHQLHWGQCHPLPWAAPRP